jgi:hypothetical protein
MAIYSRSLKGLRDAIVPCCSGDGTNSEEIHTSNSFIGSLVEKGFNCQEKHDSLALLKEAIL